MIPSHKIIKYYMHHQLIFFLIDSVIAFFIVEKYNHTFYIYSLCEKNSYKWSITIYNEKSKAYSRIEDKEKFSDLLVNIERYKNYDK